MDEKDHNNSTFSVADMEQIVSDASLGAESFTGFNTPVNLHVHSVRKRLADSEGVSAKAAIDGIIHAEVLPNDSPKEIKTTSYSQEKGDKEYTVITIEEQ